MRPKDAKIRKKATQIFTPFQNGRHAGFPTHPVLQGIAKGLSQTKSE